MTAPLTPPDLDLRDFPYMPLDVVRLRDSELAVISSGEEFRAAVLLWCAAWHQVPAASLPDDDRLLASLAGFGRDIKAWEAVRDTALHGFVKCSDGRFYHPVIAEKAIEAAAKKKSQRQRTAAATVAAANRRNNDDRHNNVPASVTDTVTDVVTERSQQSVADHVSDVVTDTVTDTVTETKGREGKGIDRKPPVVPPSGGTPPDGNALDPPKPRRRKPATLPMPDRASPEFTALRTAFFDYGRSRRLPEPALAEEFDFFIGHHQAKGNVFADWTAAGQNWLRRTQRFNQPRGAPTGRPQI
ncbi:hypothetical protein NB311A_11997 [Nitrobacter sp. Nb-311A]|uniref:DUF1376 domain-containing protein n=1 Tax=Nitrobacter sp. Nb-311A TaxID=314253 RepID=UPI00006852ED|nr:DUF1376 domain-containing protein [Nitrobacter sp. Nb-311A]EAQ34463.1 hypothetical protein NB311A_11997 [Nitrobacter sp. Nb-311A]